MVKKKKIQLRFANGPFQGKVNPGLCAAQLDFYPNVAVDLVV